VNDREDPHAIYRQARELLDQLRLAAGRQDDAGKADVDVMCDLIERYCHEFERRAADLRPEELP